MQDVANYTKKQNFWTTDSGENSKSKKVSKQRIHLQFKPFMPIKKWLDQVQVNDIKLAHFICKNIPAQCPFERDIEVGKYTLHIPPLCKLNPVYEELVCLRFRALCYLADDCGLDISAYC